MKFKIFIIGYICILIPIISILAYHRDIINKHSDSGTLVSNGTVECTVYIIEKDGYKFAVAVGYNSCSITQIK